MVKCEVCREEYQDVELELHRATCIARTLFRCCLCIEDFVNKEGLWNHLDLHEIADESKESHYQEIEVKYQLHKCVLCNSQRAYTATSYREHIENVHDGFFLRCSDRGEQFRSVRLKDDHISGHCQVMGQPVASDKRKTCETAHSKLSHEDLINNANRKCNNRLENQSSDSTGATCNTIVELDSPKNMSCHFCGEMFASQDLLRLHQIKSHKDPKYDCSLCGRKFLLQNKLDRHRCRGEPEMQQRVKRVYRRYQTGKRQPRNLRQESSEEVVRCHQYSCQWCSYTSSSYRLFHHHTLTRHIEGEFKCPHCLSDFHYKSQLNMHLAGCKKLNLSCDLCGQKFNMTSRLKYHMEKFHSDHAPREDAIMEGVECNADQRPDNVDKTGAVQETTVCSICETMFAGIDELKRHEQTCSVHEDKRVAQSNAREVQLVQSVGKSRRDSTNESQIKLEFTAEESMLHEQKHLETPRNSFVASSMKSHTDPTYDCSLCGRELHHQNDVNCHRCRVEPEMQKRVNADNDKRRYNTVQGDIKNFLKAKPTPGDQEQSTDALSDGPVQATKSIDSQLNEKECPKEVVPEGGNTLSVEENVPNQKYSCHLCDFTTRTSHSFRYHWITRHTEGKFKCPLCSRNFHYKRNFNIHVACCEKLNFSCDLCAQRFNMPSKLKHHMEQFHADHEACGDANMEGVECNEDQRPDNVDNADVFQKAIVCIFCKTVFDNTEELMNHKQICAVHEQNQHDGHSNAGEVQLSQTAKKGQHDSTIVSQIKLEFTAEESMLQEHQNLGASMNSFVASVHSDSSYSLETVAPKDEITVHKETDRTPVEKSALPPISGPPWQCSICKMMFKDIRYLKYHRVIHHTEPRLKCCICSKGFHYPPALHRHWKGCSKLRCSICNIKCATYANLKNHKWKSHRIQEDIVDEQQRAIMRPEMSCDPKKASKPVWSCSICNLEFDKYHSHRYHMTVSHTEPQYQCSLCHTEFHFTRSARRHEKGCLESRCHECGISFTTHGLLKKHNSSKHDSTANDTAAANQRGYDMNGLGDETNESKPLDCQSQKTACPESADKSFPCSICGRVFARQQLLDYHKSTCPTKRKAPENPQFSGSDIPLLPNVVESKMDKQTVPQSACVEKDIKARPSAKYTTKQSKGPKKRNKYDGIQSSLTAEVIESQTNRLIVPQREDVELKPDIVLEDTTLQDTDPDESFAASSLPCPKECKEIESQTIRQIVPQGEDIEIKLEIKVGNAIGQDT